MTDVTTPAPDRRDLAKVFTDPKLLRQMEALLRDVRNAIPGNIAEVDAKAQEALDDAAAAMIAANNAQADATLALALIAALGGGWVEIEVDFGSNPRRDFKFTITDANISPTSKVIVSPSGKPATGRGSDDWQWDTASFAANPTSGSATVYGLFTGKVKGKRYIQYQVS